MLRSTLFRGTPMSQPERIGEEFVLPGPLCGGQRQLFLSSGDNYNLPVAQG
jgi:hypothetical protein